MISCDKCNESIMRKDMQNHINTTCPLSITNCSNADMGCTWRDKRNKLQEHIKTACAVEAQRPLIKRLEAAEDSIKWLTSQLSNFMSFSSMLLSPGQRQAITLPIPLPPAASKQQQQQQQNAPYFTSERFYFFGLLFFATAQVSAANPKDIQITLFMDKEQAQNQRFSKQIMAMLADVEIYVGAKQPLTPKFKNNCLVCNGTAIAVIVEPSSSAVSTGSAFSSSAPTIQTHFYMSLTEQSMKTYKCFESLEEMQVYKDYLKTKHAMNQKKN